MARLFALLPLALTLCLGPSAALAQDDEDPIFDEFPDDVDEAEEITKPSESQVLGEQEKLVDVVRGTYIQAMLTETKFVGLVSIDQSYGTVGYDTVGAHSQWGVGVKVSAGTELVDSPSFTLGLEGSYGQAAFNGNSPSFYATTPIQGDFRGHTFQASLKPAVVLGKARRWALVGKVSAGVFRAEALVAEANQPMPGLHASFKPFGGAGLGLEYYSKLSHFSVTLVEAELLYVVGFDAALAVNFVGLKYTF